MNKIPVFLVVLLIGVLAVVTFMFITNTTSKISDTPKTSPQTVVLQSACRGNFSLVNGSCLSQQTAFDCDGVIAEAKLGYQICGKILHEYPPNVSISDLNDLGLNVSIRGQAWDTYLPCTQTEQVLASQVPCDSVYSNIDLSFIGLTACEAFQDQIERDDCYSDTAFLNSRESICELISNQSVADLCYSNIAAITRDLSLCEKVKGDSRNYQCRSEIAKITGNISICPTLSTDQGTVDGCYFNIAMRQEDASVCQFIQDADVKAQCPYIVATTTGEMSACEAYNTQDERDSCYSSAAIMLSNPSTCELIKDSGRKNLCRWSFE